MKELTTYLRQHAANRKQLGSQSCGYEPFIKAADFIDEVEIILYHVDTGNQPAAYQALKELRRKP